MILSGTPEPIRLLINEREAAKALAISPRKLWTLRQCGEICHVRTGRSIRYDVADLRAWIERNKKLTEPSRN